MVKDPAHPRHFDAAIAACRYVFPTLQAQAVMDIEPLDDKANAEINQDLIKLLIKNADSI